MLFAAILGPSTIPPPPVKSPEISPVNDFSHIVGEALSKTLTATCYDCATPLQWSISEHPSWLSLTGNGLSAVLSGTPTGEAVADNVIVTVTDNGGRSTSIEFNVTVLPAAQMQLSIAVVETIPDTAALETATDWLYAGRTAVANRDSKSGATAISTLTQVGNGALNYHAGGANTKPVVSWASGGDPTASASNIKGSVLAVGAGVAGRGFTLEIAATKDSPQTVRLYLAGIGVTAGAAKGKLSVALSEAATDIRSVEQEFAATTLTMFAVDVTFEAKANGTTLDIDWINLNTNGSVAFRAAVLGAPGVGGSHFSIDPATLKSEQYVPIEATLTYSGPNTSGVALMADTLPANAYLYDDGDSTGGFINRYDTVITNTETIVFSAMRAETLLASLNKTLLQDNATPTDPPEIGIPGDIDTWEVTKGQDNTLAITCDEQVSVAGLRYRMQWVPDSSGGGVLSWAPLANADDHTELLTLSASDSEGRRTVKTLTATSAT